MRHWTAEDANRRGWLYTFKADVGFEVHNRAGEVIHRDETYKAAEDWANANTDAIDEPLTRHPKK